MTFFRQTTFLVACFIGSGQAYGVLGESKFRTKLRSAFSETICQKSFPDHPLDIWKLGIYEAQIAGKTYAPFRGKKLTDHFLSAQSKSLSRKNYHLSRIWGTCEDGTGWVGSWPAPRPLVVKKGARFSIPYQPLLKNCGDFRIDYAAHGGGQPKRLTVGTVEAKATVLLVDGSHLEPGTIAVTCYPNEPKWRGPVMWYFAPVKAGPSADVPLAAKLNQGPQLRDNLVEWVQSVRAAEGLPSLSHDHKSLRSHADRLASDFGLTHDRRQLASIAEDVKNLGMTFLGENRFRGQTNLEIGWLLWNSPRHRALILSRKATHMAVAARTIGSQLSGVIILAQ